MGVKANRYKNRLIFVCLAMILAFSIILGALFYWQIAEADTLQRRALGQWTSSTTLAASRGTIYDATGEALAISASSKSLNAKPKALSQSLYSPEDITQRLIEILGENYSYDSVYKKIAYDKETSLAEYVVARHLTDEQVAAVQSLIDNNGLSGLILTDDVKRYYPKGASLAQVLGGVNDDGVGSDGLELAYDKLLRGLTGRLVASTDVSAGQIPGGEQRYVDATSGANPVLTVDYAMQSFAEGVMRQCMEETGAAAVRCILMEPDTGAVKAMVNLPDYDPNTATRAQRKELGRNGCILDTYEPGSTEKIFTLAAALNEGKVSTSSTFYCPGYHLVEGEKIHCWRSVPHGTQTLQEAVCNSCNPAFMQIGLDLGQETLYKYLYDFGFNTTTGVDFSSDQAGILLAPKYVSTPDLARISFGQSIAITPLQLITAGCAVINGGTLYQPRLVGAFRDDQGQVLETIEPVAVRQVVSPETSATMRSLLEGVVSKGGGKNAQVEGYRVGGKTGTAQKYRDGVVVKDVHIGSFFGFAPADDPKIAILVTVDEATVPNDYGSNTAAPYAGKILERVLKYLHIKPTEEEKTTVTVPSVTGCTCEEAAAILAASHLQAELSGTGRVSSQTPGAGELVEEYSIVHVSGSDPDGETVYYGMD